MPLKEADHHIIEKHLLQQLLPEEQALFEQRMEDADFRKELSLQKDLHLAFKAEGRSHLKAQLQGFEEKRKPAVQQKENTSKFSIGRFLAIAATLALLLTATYWLFSKGPSNDQLYAQFFEPYPNIVAPIEKSNTSTDRRDEAFQTYELKNYKKALELFEQLNTQDEAVHFYSGLCQLALNQPEKAIEDFKSIQQQDGPYYAPMNWYQALALVKTGRPEAAKPYLDLVIKTAKTQTLQTQARDLQKLLAQD